MCRLLFFFKQKTAYEMRISDWSSDVCSSDLTERYTAAAQAVLAPGERINSLTMPEGNGPVVVAATQASKGPPRGRPVRTMVYLDPPTAKVLDQAASNEGVQIGRASCRERVCQYV